MSNQLLETYQLLAAGLHCDPLLCLANAVTWLDPFWQDDYADELDDEVNDDGALALAFRVIRSAFPDIYVQAVDAIRRGASYNELDTLICGAINERGILLDSLEWIGFGVPISGHGVSLEDPEFYQQHPDVMPVLACFGISPEPNPFNIDVPECAYTAGRLIAADLEQHEEERYRQVSWLLQWLFSCSGNSSIDFDYETMSEMEPLSWEQDELAFAIDIIEEADGILNDALKGLAFVNAHPEVLQAIEWNVRQLYRGMNRRKGKYQSANPSLHWPEFP